ncbi:hypothetical protein C6994_21995 [Klebsiella sp. CVUAS 10191.3]|nr:hypothetical protein [Klebsiella sp. CVUAS 10191.3]
MLTTLSCPSHIVIYAAGDSLICRRDASRMTVCNKTGAFYYSVTDCSAILSRILTDGSEATTRKSRLTPNLSNC